MSLEKIDSLLERQLQSLDEKGSAKRHEKVITAVVAGPEGCGPRYLLEGFGGRQFLRMNSNSYLGLSGHPEVIAAEEAAAAEYGTGPGAVRFISGTFRPHKLLEEKLADFHGRESALLFSAAYATVLGVLPQFISEETLVISDELNHNCIINAVRLARPADKAVYPHLDVRRLERLVEEGKGRYRRALLVSDGVFSMRGDYAPLDRIAAICARHEDGYPEGIITVIDDSHGVGAFGRTGRGTEEVTGARADVLVATLGKAFGVNGGYVASSRRVTDYLQETAPLYIYSNPITPAEAAAALKSLEVTDSGEGAVRLEALQSLHRRLRTELLDLGYEIIEGEHPVVAVLVRDTAATSALVQHLFEHNILATGLNFPVVPEGEQEVRLQVSASHTERDLDCLVAAFASFPGRRGV